MTTHSEAALAERYGRQDPARRRAVVIASGVVGVLALGWLVWVIWFQSTPEVRSAMHSFDVLGEHEVTATFEVITSSSDVVADCLVRAFGEDHAVVGERNVEVTGVDGKEQRTVRFRTEREATSLELVGCNTADQARRR